VSLPEAVARAIERETGPVRGVSPVGGGCIASASRVETQKGIFFLKWAGPPVGETFEAEAAGLGALRHARTPLLIPDVIAVADASDDHPGYLLMSWIEPGRPNSDFGNRLGEGLALLHGTIQPDGRYGFERDNFIGRLPQYNAWHADWPAFFREMRLEPQIRMARDSGRWRRGWNVPADRLLDRLPDLLPLDPPAATCHGDLWSGNVLCAADGTPALFDPATYFGHGETDLAMMTLFGGFDRPVFEAYHEIHPRQPGHGEREAVYQLYHLINHLNHFGESYAGGVERVLGELAR
jgi:protein-ribulosamine 3-kinase